MTRVLRPAGGGTLKAARVLDADTGFGEALNVMATVRALELAGAAAIHIEGQILPKKCGHLSDMLPRMQRRAELYETIGYFEYEGLDGQIARSVIPGP